MGPTDDNVKVKALLPAISMFQDPPAWTTAAEAPSDWALLQRAKALRLEKAQGEVDMRESESKPEAQNIPGLTEYPLAVAAAGLAPSSHYRMSSLHFGFVALLAVGFLLLSTTTTTTSFSNVATRVFHPVKVEPRGSQLFLPRAKRQTKKILGQASIFAASVDNDKCSALVDEGKCSAPVDNDKCSAPVSRCPVTTNNSADADIDTKPSTNVPSIVGASTFLEDFEFTAPFLTNYYALGSFFADKSQHVWSALCRQLVKLRVVVWDDDNYNSFYTSTISMGRSFVADKPHQHVRSLLHRLLAKVRGLVHGVLVVPLPCVS